MRIIKTASGKQTLKISKAEWLDLGKKAGWVKKAYESDEIWVNKHSIIHETRVIVSEDGVPGAYKKFIKSLKERFPNYGNDIIEYIYTLYETNDLKKIKNYNEEDYNNIIKIKKMINEVEKVPLPENFPDTIKDIEQAEIFRKEYNKSFVLIDGLYKKMYRLEEIYLEALEEMKKEKEVEGQNEDDYYFNELNNQRFDDDSAFYNKDLIRPQF